MEQRVQRWELAHNICRVVTEEDDSQIAQNQFLQPQIAIRGGRR